MVAALGNLQIRVMLGRQPHADIRHQVDEGIVRLGQVGMHRAHHLVGGVRAGHGQDRRMRVAHHIALGPRQPVTITLPFSFKASPIASSDSATAESMKPQVLTTTRSAPA